MQLIERYIEAVKFWLPKAQQEDIAAELHTNILAQAEDREAALGRPLQEDEESPSSNNSVRRHSSRRVTVPIKARSLSDGNGSGHSSIRFIAWR